MATSERRDRLQASLGDAYREADKLIVTVSSGVLALSVAFLGRLDKPNDLWVLRSSWFALVAAVVCVLGSLIFEQADKRRRIKQLDDNKPETDGKTDGFINFLNILGVCAFVLGLIGLAAFLFFNTN